MIDVAELATEVVATIAPVLPILVEEGREAADELSAEYIPAVRSRAQEIWNTLRPSLENKPGATDVIDHVAEKPDDQDAHAALRFFVRTILSEDSQLADEICEITKQDDK